MTIWNDPEHSEWFDLSTRTGDFVDRLIDRGGVLVSVTPDIRSEELKAKQQRPAGVYFPTLAKLHLDASQTLPKDLKELSSVNPASKLSQRRYPAFMGVAVHESAHAKHTHHRASHEDRIINDWIAVLEEPRCEHKMVQEFPQYIPHLKAASKHIFGEDAFQTPSIKANDALKKRFAAARIAILLLGRAEAGIFNDDEVANVRNLCRSVLGMKDFKALRAVWVEALALDNNCKEEMVALAIRVQAIVDPEDEAEENEEDQQQTTPCGSPPPEEEEQEEEQQEETTDEDSKKDDTDEDSTDGEDDSNEDSDSEDSEDGDSEGDSDSEDSAGDSNEDSESGESEDDSEDGKGGTAGEDSEEETDGEGSEGDADSEGTEGEGDSEGEGSEGDSEGADSSGKSGGKGSDSDSKNGNPEDGDPNGEDEGNSDGNESQNGNDSDKGDQDSSTGSDIPETGDYDRKISDSDISDLINEAITSVESATEHGEQEAAESGKPETLAPKRNEQQENLAHRKEINAAKGKIKAPGVRSAGLYSSVPRVTLQEPSASDISRARTIGLALEKAQYRDVHKTTLNSIIPPGRFRVRQAMNRSSQLAMKQEVTATPWSQTRRREVDNPPITFAVASDISGSMDYWQREVSSFTWAFSQAVSKLQGRSGAVVWNSDTYGLIEPNRASKQIPVSNACGGSSGLPGAIMALDGMMDLSFGEGVRVLAIITDGDLLGYEQIQKNITKLSNYGVKILWILTDDRGWRPKNATTAVLHTPQDFGKVVGAKVIEALSQA